MNPSNPDRDSLSETLHERAAHHSDWVNIHLSGQAPAVEAMVHLLHHLNVIAASDWSQIVPLKDSPIVIRVASRGMRSTPPDEPRSPESPGTAVG